MATFAQIRDGLTLESEALYLAMVDAHLASKPGMRHFVLADSMAGSSLAFAGSAPFSSPEVDGSALNDLVSYGLLRRRVGGRGRAYEVSGESLRFYRWLQEQRGGPVAAVETAARTLADSSSYAKAHPSAAAHLSKAFTMLWSDRTDSAATSSIGHELRSALIDAVAAAIGPPPDNPEDVSGRLDRWKLADSTDRERAAVAALVHAAWRLAQRLTHIDDETAQGRPLRGHDELRRAAFVTATACLELDATGV